MRNFVDLVVVCSLFGGNKCSRQVVDFLCFLVVDPESCLVSEFNVLDHVVYISFEVVKVFILWSAFS